MVKAETLGTRIWQKSLKESRTSPNQQSYPVSKKSEEDLQKRIENKAYELMKKEAVSQAMNGRIGWKLKN